MARRDMESIFECSDWISRELGIKFEHKKIVSYFQVLVYCSVCCINYRQTSNRC